MEQNPPIPFSKTLCNFSDLIGNAQAKEILYRWVEQGTMPQVLLFHGPRGVGKGVIAERVARALLQSTKIQHPDLHIIRPDIEADQHLITTLRQVIEETSLPPFEASCKIFIIHDVEKMVPTSGNTLLKTLEEPPPDTQFILLTSQPSLLLPTILSRCSKIAFYPIPEEELAQFLLTKHHVKEAAKIALLSEGSVAEALHRVSQQKPIVSVDALCRVKGYTELYHILHSLSDDYSSLETDRLFEEILLWIREYDPLRLEKAIPLIHEARIALFHHVKLKIVLERFFIKYQLKY